MRLGCCFSSFWRKFGQGQELVQIFKISAKKNQPNFAYFEEVDDDEQAEIEAILDAMTEDDKEIVRTERIFIEL